MCGIVGYIGPREAYPILIDGLKRLEYRGYDSAGIALWEDGAVAILKEEGRLEHLNGIDRLFHKKNTKGVIFQLCIQVILILNILQISSQMKILKKSQRAIKVKLVPAAAFSLSCAICCNVVMSSG